MLFGLKKIWLNLKIYKPRNVCIQLKVALFSLKFANFLKIFTRLFYLYSFVAQTILHPTHFKFSKKFWIHKKLQANLDQIDQISRTKLKFIDQILIRTKATLVGPTRHNPFP
jgi:hypothetical protein